MGNLTTKKKVNKKMKTEKPGPEWNSLLPQTVKNKPVSK
jgi:hypothetical protein